MNSKRSKREKAEDDFRHSPLEYDSNIKSQFEEEGHKNSVDMKDIDIDVR
jgi:hypothetical protein